MIDERWDSEVEEIAEALARMLAAECTGAVVRSAEAEHRGDSPEVGRLIDAFGLNQLEGSVALFTRIAVELGRALAPVPFVETMPVLALTGEAGVAWTDDGLAPASLPRVAVVRDGELIAEALSGQARQTAAGDYLVEHQPGGAGDRLGDAALADRCARYAKLICAARIVGAAQALLRNGCSYVAEREQFGRAIGSFQAVGHRLANVAAELDAADLMLRKASFAAEPEVGGDGAPPAHFAIMAWVLAVRAGRSAATNIHQVFGGNGFAMEYDVQLYSRRIRSWAMRGPRPERLLGELGRMVLDPVRRDDMAMLWQFDRGISLPRWAREADAEGA